MGRCHVLLLIWALSAHCADAQCILPREGYEGEMLCARNAHEEGNDLLHGHYDEDRRLKNSSSSSSGGGKGKREKGGGQAPPHGTTLKMFVRPEFEMWAGLDFAGGFANGIFGVEQIWKTDSESYFAAADAAEIVRVSNFNGGNSGLVAQPIIQISSPHGDLYEVRRQFQGKFKQKFDATCFPYDHQDVKFTVVMEKPVSSYWEMFLLCPEGHTAKDSAGNVITNTKGQPENIDTCTKELDSLAVGMTWDRITCKKKSGAAITCDKMGVRDNTRIMINFFLPALMVTMMSFASFMLHISMAMPRIATTMIAMLTLINLRNALAKSLPGSGNLSWMEKYFLCATIFMFFNLCCHVLAMALHKKNKPNMSDFVDDLGSGVSFCLSIVLPFLLLSSSGCTDEGISSGAAAAVIVLGLLLLIAVLGKTFWAKKDAVKAWQAARKEGKGGAEYSTGPSRSELA